MSFLLTILGYAKSILVFAIVLGIIVLIHEFGHYLAARLMGVRVETFSFGFGKRLFGKQVGDTDFRLSLIPLGGYVKMAGEEEWDPDNLKPDEFQAKNRAQKIFILFMGPAMNLLLAFIIFTMINITGVEAPAYKSEPPLIGYVEKGSPAEAAGIRKGDKILSVDGSEVKDFKELEIMIGSNPDQKVKVEVKRDGQVLEKQLEVKAATRFHLGDAGFEWGFKTKVNEVTKNSPAFKSGLKAGDILEAVNGRPVTFFEFSDAVNGSDGQTLNIEVKREDGQFNVDITPVKAYRLEKGPLDTVKVAREILKDVRAALPELKFNADRIKGKYIVFSSDFDTKEEAEKYGKLSSLKLNRTERWIIGIAMQRYSPSVETRYALFAAMKKSVNDIVDLTVLVFNTFKKMIVGKLSPKSLSGPLEIARVSERAFDSGASNFFMLIAFISLQLGIINLFPIPALDGGHLMIFSIEAIFRKEFSQKVKGILMNIGFLILIALMLFVILNDVAKTLPNGWSSFWPF
jgi:regulator of sigma E protease